MAVAIKCLQIVLNQESTGCFGVGSAICKSQLPSELGHNNSMLADITVRHGLILI